MPEYILAFDFGLKHIGVAVGQTVTRTASPIDTLAARDGKLAWENVASLIDDWSPTALIVGLPLNMDGTESDMSSRARPFAQRLNELPAVGPVDHRVAATGAERGSGFGAAGDGFQ